MQEAKAEALKRENIKAELSSVWHYCLVETGHAQCLRNSLIYIEYAFCIRIPHGSHHFIQRDRTHRVVILDFVGYVLELILSVYILMAMRKVFFLLLSSMLLLANVANASMLCCTDLEQPKMEQIEESPCHTSSDDATQAQDMQHECDCDACTNLTGVLPPGMGTLLALIPILSIVSDDFTSSLLAVIFHPPITAS